MSHTNSNKISLLFSLFLLSCSSSIYAFEVKNANQQNIIIPMISNAQVFANITDELPAVLNYFTSATEEQIIKFYQQHYGDYISQERKRGRLTLSYQHAKKAIRIVISQQNKKRQVDVIMELKSNS